MQQSLLQELSAFNAPHRETVRPERDGELLDVLQEVHKSLKDVPSAKLFKMSSKVIYDCRCSPLPDRHFWKIGVRGVSDVTEAST